MDNINNKNENNKDVVKISYEITNCLDCQNHEVHSLYTSDSWEHESGCFCSLMEQTKEDEERMYGNCCTTSKFIGQDDWNLRKYCDIPNWCPLLEQNKNK